MTPLNPAELREIVGSNQDRLIREIAQHIRTEVYNSLQHSVTYDCSCFSSYKSRDHLFDLLLEDLRIQYPGAFVSRDNHMVTVLW